MNDTSRGRSDLGSFAAFGGVTPAYGGPFSVDGNGFVSPPPPTLYAEPESPAQPTRHGVLDPGVDFRWSDADIYDAAQDAAADLVRTLCQRHLKYGSRNIAASPGGALNGLRVRLHDKLARLNQAVDSGVEDYDDETLRDTLVDIAGYAVIGLLVLDGDWPTA